MTRILAISAGLSAPSSSRLLVDRLTAAAREEFDSGEPTVTTVELRDHAHEITDHLLTGFPGQRLRGVLDEVAAADGLILVTPTFMASYNGLFKSFMDVVEPESLDGKPVLIGATGGTERHSLVLDHALRPLLAYLRATVVPTGVYAANSDWGNDTDLDRRTQRAASEFARLIESRPAPRRSDPFAEPVPFDQLLEDVSPR
ncbi:NADPH-dependent FMN reductase [Allosaccharopolyspora coralli]|uniref:NADPH-dependent FMN reductase n=1 Tax=Allosaccharopolyspora coralli TaxID=2665642 RepID=A0A5Q3QDG4_9PSEU|nr:FMN reductase [Allosaccharopolyspora coralli]QGK69599.1 NADPH-dependent FMN reductase [Allosaccharopolyspora coralli]